MLAIIAAMARNRVIGSRGKIPWDIPADMKFFREMTTGHTVIMGRKTFESIGQALPKRRCIVISRQTGFEAPGCEVAGSLTDALALCTSTEQIFVVGGGEIYRQALPHAGRIYLSVIDRDVEGDVLFPEIPADEFTELRQEVLSNDPSCVLIIYERRETGDRAV